jgi:putative FmdB family regulatory protein
MPIYEIVCDECGRAGEVLALSGTEALVCPYCGSDRTTKLMSPTSSITDRPTPPAAEASRGMPVAPARDPAAGKQADRCRRRR